MSVEQLKSELSNINAYIGEHAEYLKVNRTLFEIYNGNLCYYLCQAIDNETKSALTREEIKARLNTTNILTKVVQKLSKVYNAKVARKLLYSDKEHYQEIFDEMEINLRITQKMKNANELMNISNCVAIEPVFIDGMNEIRVIPAHQFLPYSNNKYDKTKMTHFIKFIGEDKILNERNEMNIYSRFIVYDNESWLECNTGGDIYSSGDHFLGEIPFVYINKNEYLLKPFEDADTLHMCLLLPLMLTDLNFALRFQSHSIVYGVNVDASNLSMTPNAFWSFSSNGQDGDKPIIGTINPSVDSEKMIATVNHEFTLWLDTKNIKTDALRQSYSGDTMSGISKAIDNADVNDIVDQDTILFKDAEDKLWNLVRKMYNSKFIETKINIDYLEEDFLPTIIFYRKPVVIETSKEKLENIITKIYNNFMTVRMALKEIYPDMSDDEIEMLIKEIKNERLSKESTDNYNDSEGLSNINS
ncbi:MAG TPA: hypothetical protein DCS19_10545 [Flavobacterium sp.]|nr:hypothetical protein [Flavobacterium sp.]